MQNSCKKGAWLCILLCIVHFTFCSSFLPLHLRNHYIVIEKPPVILSQEENQGDLV